MSNLAGEMRRRGSHRPIVLVIDWAAAEPQVAQMDGITVVRWRLRGPALGTSVKARLATWWWRRRFGPRFASFCQQHRVVAINPHYPTEAALALEPIARDHGVQAPFVLSFHGADLSGLEATDAQTRLAWRGLLGRAQAVVTCSAALGQRLTAAFGVVPEVVHNGIDAAAFERKAGQPAGWQGQRRLILSVGKFEQKKGQDVLVRAFASLARRHADLDLMLVGATDSALSPLRRLCQELGVEDRVLFRPDTPHDEVARLFAQATLFVLPSRQEPFGIVLLEAGCLALPVVATRVGGIPEILQDGVTARLVPPDDPAAIEQAIDALISEPQAAQAMGQRLRAHVVQAFSWSLALDRYLAAAAGRSSSR